MRCQNGKCKRWALLPLDVCLWCYRVGRRQARMVWRCKPAVKLTDDDRFGRCRNCHQDSDRCECSSTAIRRQVYAEQEELVEVN